MCGIAFYLSASKDISSDLSHRGPDCTNSFSDILNNFTLDFYRLKINDLSDDGNQPMQIGDCVLICNGEIFNHTKIRDQFGFQLNTGSDCEVILHLYMYLRKRMRKASEEFIIQMLCNHLDGEFAFCLCDMTHNLVYCARDPFGVRPLFINHATGSVASELKAFDPSVQSGVVQFPPGYFSVMYKYDPRSVVVAKYKPDLTRLSPNTTRSRIVKDVKNLLCQAVRKRVMSDRPICALLSGGLDSSLVAALAAKYLPYPLMTFSIGFEGSPDLHYAQKVATHIGSNHTEILVTPTDFLNAIEEVVRCIESYDTTTVRASVGNYLVAKYIKEHTDCVVVFNGDYADEVCGGYKYLQNCACKNEFHNDCMRLVDEIYYFDSLRSDRTISAHGLEARVPFADKRFVMYYMSISPSYRTSHTQIEKLLVREAFDGDDLLPKEVLWRRKEAFSDGVSKSTESWGDIVRRHVDTIVSDEEFGSMNHKKFKLKETYYYHKLFSKYYDGETKVIPHLWMPKFCDESVVDPSARKL